MNPRPCASMKLSRVLFWILPVLALLTSHLTSIPESTLLPPCGLVLSPTAASAVFPKGYRLVWPWDTFSDTSSVNST